MRNFSLQSALIINNRLDILFDEGKSISQFTTLVGCEIL